MNKNLKPKTIAIVTNNYKPYSGGVVSSIISLTDELRSQGHKVYIITLEFLENHIPEKGVIRLNCPVKFKYYSNNLAIPWRPCHNLCKIFEEIKPDIIHSQHPFYLGHCALRAARCKNIPIIFTYHTQYEKYVHYLPFPETLSAPITKLIALDYCKRVDAIVAPSQSIAGYLKQEDIKTPINVIPSGISPIFFQAATKTSMKINRKFKLITVSRFVKEKNIPFLLEVFSKLDQNKFEFTLVGYGPEQEALKLLAFEKLKIQTNSINFITAPSKQELARLYQEADLFIFASTTETQGLVLAEAMASNTPAIAVRAPGSNDIIINDQNGFLVDNQDEMILKINQLQNSPEQLKRIKKEARRQSKNYAPKNSYTTLS
jgi:1,2-diacylglycerol 3-alpha-glucosyltransferase